MFHLRGCVDETSTRASLAGSKSFPSNDGLVPTVAATAPEQFLPPCLASRFQDNESGESLTDHRATRAALSLMACQRGRIAGSDT